MDENTKLWGPKIDWSRALPWGVTSFALSVILVQVAAFVLGEHVDAGLTILVGVLTALSNGVETGASDLPRHRSPLSVWAMAVAASLLVGIGAAAIAVAVPQSVLFAGGFVLTLPTVYVLLLLYHVRRLTPPNHPDNIE